MYFFIPFVFLQIILIKRRLKQSFNGNPIYVKVPVSSRGHYTGQFHFFINVWLRTVDNIIGKKMLKNYADCFPLCMDKNVNFLLMFWSW